MMEYKGYIGKAEIDEEAGIIHGEVINTRDVITFQGQSLVELENAFHESVDDYLEFCQQRGETPDKPFSGQFVTRVPPELHRKVNMAAAVAGQSLNAWVAEQLLGAVHHLESNRKVRGKKLRLKNSKGKIKPIAKKAVKHKKRSQQQA